MIGDRRFCEFQKLLDYNGEVVGQKGSLILVLQGEFLFDLGIVLEVLFQKFGIFEIEERGLLIGLGAILVHANQSLGGTEVEGGTLEVRLEVGGLIVEEDGGIQISVSFYVFFLQVIVIPNAVCNA